MPRIHVAGGYAAAAGLLLACTVPADEQDTASAPVVARARDCLNESETWLRAQTGSRSALAWKRVLTRDEAGDYSEQAPFAAEGSSLTLVRTLNRSGNVSVRVRRRTGSTTTWEGAELAVPGCAPQAMPSLTESSAAGASSILDNETTDRLLNEHPNLWVLAISPDMPLSFEAVRPVYEIARRRGATLILALSGVYVTGLTPKLEEKLRPYVQDRHVPLYRLDRSNDLVLTGLGNHFPNLALFKSGRFSGLVSGYKDDRSEDLFVEHALSENPETVATPDEHLAEIRAVWATMKNVRFDVRREEAVPIGIPYLGSYYRPLRDSGVLVFPQNDERGLFLFDLRNRRSRFVATGADNIAPYDVIGLPFTESTALIFSTGATYSNALLDLSAPLSSKGGSYRSVHITPSGNIYPSGGLLEATETSSTYQIISNWGDTAMQEMTFAKGPDGLVFQSQGPEVRLCPNAFLSTPHIAPRGRLLTATVNGVGTVFQFDRGETCDPVYTFGVAASKIDSNADLSRFLFHAGYLEFAGPKFTSKSNGSFVLDRASGLIQKINVGDTADAWTTYPSFLSGDKVVYYYSPPSPQTATAVVVDVKRVVVR
jgi:hypothetical protein